MTTLKHKLIWLLLKYLSRLLDVENECTIVVFERDNTVVMQQAGKNKERKQF